MESHRATGLATFPFGQTFKPNRKDKNFPAHSLMSYSYHAGRLASRSEEPVCVFCGGIQGIGEFMKTIKLLFVIFALMGTTLMAGDKTDRKSTRLNSSHLG